MVSPFTIILFAVLLRLAPHPANVAPIGALALFGGLYLNKNYALIVPIGAMIVSDMFLGFHNTMLFVYGSFLITGLIGLWFHNKRSVQNIFLASLLSSTVFFVITNVGVWIFSSVYAKNLSGLIQCFAYAIPFFRNTLIGDLFYISLFAGSYELILKVLPRLASQKG